MTEQEKNDIMIRRSLSRCLRYRYLLKHPETYGVDGPRMGLKHDQMHLLGLRIKRQTGVYPARH